MLVLSSDDIRKCLPMSEAIEAAREAFAAYSDARAEAPLRTRLAVIPHDGEMLLMPAYVQAERSEALAVKVVSIFPGNAARGIPLIHAAVLAFEPDTGRPQAVLHGGTLTALRTGAASGAATALLSREDSRIAAIFGTGVQARTQLDGICTVRKIETVWVYCLNETHLHTFISEMAGKTPIPGDIRPAVTPAEAVRNADIICTATTSRTPVLRDSDLKEGVHINGVGSYTPEMQEIPPETVSRAYVVVDSVEASIAEAGDLIQPVQKGLIPKSRIHTELGQIIAGEKPGRTSPKQITFFKSVGLAVQDATAAQAALRNALKLGLGHEANW